MNNDKTLNDYNIKHESVLECIFKIEEGFQILINGFNWKTTVIRVNLNTTIENVKEIIYEKIGILPNFQRLMFDQKQLEDERTIQYYHLTTFDTLHLYSRFRRRIINIFNNN